METRNRKYLTTVQVYVPNLNGDFATNPDVRYTKMSESLEEAKDIKDILWQAVELDGLDGIVCIVEVLVEDESGKYIDSDELYFQAATVVRDRTKPSEYVIWGRKTPHIFSVVREESVMLFGDSPNNLS